MLIQILIHTPLYVWALLAFLVYRGLAAMRERPMTPRRLLVIPLLMLGLSAQDIAAKFGLGGPPLAAWLLGAGAATALVWRFGTSRIVAAADGVRMRGSAAPLALMLGVFVIKYAASVAWAIGPRLHQDAAFGLVLCALFGVLNGCFLGALGRDLRAYARAASQASASLAAALPPAKQAVSR
ncbi:DUF6622 family protein [Massilia sp. ST3]|uniref:DUF6622 family protein n=1 Tax=Massilia sp. ST3 TaxID=2824903 RepID=UPI001B81C353|nr:DUF6622 family protein [Massilia sp. ST3]MBQ5945871.1 hypothetical protein [Massilia sp. ST3]